MLPDMKGFFVVLIGLGVICGLLLAAGVPWLWGLVKPLIHALTA